MEVKVMKIYARTKFYHRIAEHKGLKADIFLTKKCIHIRYGIIYDDSKEETMRFRYDINNINEYIKIIPMLLQHNATMRLANEVKTTLDMWQQYGDFSFSRAGQYKINGEQEYDNQ